MAPAGNDDNNKHTVILPNPGGRRRVADTPQPMDPPAGPAAPPGADEWSREPWQSEGAAPPPAGGPTPPQPQPNAADAPGAAAALLRSEAALNANTMLRASAALLLMLGKLRAGLVRAQSARIMEDVARAIDRFEADMNGAGYSADQAEVAKYALAATADDVVQNIPVDDRRLWTQYSMLSQFFGERTGGIRFFEELNRMKADPLANIDVLELMYACLAVGFEGVHRTSPGGMAALQQVQRDLYDVIRRVRPRESFELSPNWQGSGIGQRDNRRRVPLWVVAACALALVVGSYMAMRALLSSDAIRVEEELLALYPLEPVTLVRPAYIPPAPPPQPVPAPEPEPAPPVIAEAPPPPPPEPAPDPCEVLREKLSADIDGARIDFAECGGDVKMTIGDRPGLVLFVSGRADIAPEYGEVIARIAPVVESVDGKVTVIGHTDAVPYRGGRFASNYELSLARAEAVAERLRAGAADPARFAVKGQGPNVPIADNATREGRARNRRVDIVIEVPR
ncbi:MAG: type VI secretion system protein TssL, long form [Acuticoccus sp.]